MERMRLEELVRVAEMHVADATGLPTTISPGMLKITPVNRGGWAARSLDAYRPLIERMAAALAADGQGSASDGGTVPDPTSQLLGDLGKVLGPVVLGVQAGYMVGHLSQRAFGQYDLPLPRPPSDELLVVPANLDAFAGQWGIPPQDLRLWVCVREVAVHSILARPHVRGRLSALLEEYVSGFEVDPGALESTLGDLDPTDPTGIQAVIGNPETLLGMMQTPRQREVLVLVEALVVAVEGYVDHVLDQVGKGLIGSYGMLTEALRRRRVEATDGDRFVQRLLGLELGRAQYDRGGAFVKGVLERAGEEGLRRLWESERELPTPAEVDAPGLWLARIDLPEE
jgi:putative hydrolase